MNEESRILRFIITKGNENDCTQTKNLLASTIREGMYILGDRAYDTDNIVNYIMEREAYAVIPSRKNRKVQRKYYEEIYKNRNRIERFFNRLKNFRRIATRYDKLVLSFISFISFIQLAAILIMIPKFSDSV